MIMYNKLINHNGGNFMKNSTPNLPLLILSFILSACGDNTQTTSEESSAFLIPPPIPRRIQAISQRKKQNIFNFPMTNCKDRPWGWAGQMAGVVLGADKEFWFRELPCPKRT